MCGSDNTSTLGPPTGKAGDLREQWFITGVHRRGPHRFLRVMVDLSTGLDLEYALGNYVFSCLHGWGSPSIAGHSRWVLKLTKTT